jgi:hypothetical protein
MTICECGLQCLLRLDVISEVRQLLHVLLLLFLLSPTHLIQLNHSLLLVYLVFVLHSTVSQSVDFDALRPLLLSMEQVFEMLVMPR